MYKIDKSIAMAAGWDAASRQMRKESRTKWNLSDRNLAAAVASDLLDKYVDEDSPDHPRNRP